MAADRDIVQNVLDGEIDKFEILIKKYRDKIFGIVGKRIPGQDHNEIAQEIFLKCFRSLDKFDLARPFENWLTGIAMRTCFDYWRQQGRRQKIFSAKEEKHEEWFEHAGNAKSLADFEARVKHEETLEILDLVLMQLKPEDRILVDMIYFQGLSLQESADIMQWKLSKVKVRAMRAREKMREHIKRLN